MKKTTLVTDKIKISSPIFMIFFAAAFISFFCNQTFFEKIIDIYSDQKMFIASIFMIYFSVLGFILNILSIGPVAKPIIILFLLFSSMQAYVTDSFGTIGDEVMIRNLLYTDMAEISDLLTLKMGLYLIFLGILPSVLIYSWNIKSQNWQREVVTHFKFGARLLATIFILLFSYSKNYASFFREHKSLRYFANPLYFAYSSIKLFSDQYNKNDLAFAAAGTDAIIPASDIKRELIIFVLGETARSDHFSLNGYSKETNPLLKKEDVLSFNNVYSCGTSTATSVPCMFSIFGRSAFDHEAAERTDNLVDVLMHTGRVNVLWRDNNSDSKGVAVRVPYEDFKTPKTNSICDEECRDEGMLVGLQEYIEKKKSGDLFIILHQMGNHGPAYFKRYPKKFEFFKPTCQNYDLGKCTTEEIHNAYDNAILYTDYFLSQVIQLLKKNSAKFETAMFYVSDHGESLGENGIYLHGLPYSIAPIAQRKVPLIMWFGGDFLHDIDFAAIKATTTNTFSHDNVFHTLLKMMEIETKLYDKSKNLIIYKPNHHE